MLPDSSKPVSDKTRTVHLALRLLLVWYKINSNFVGIIYGFKRFRQKFY